MKHKIRAGFTLVEVLIVVAVLALLLVTAIGVLNPTLQSQRGFDARKKKDLSRIKVAFEEYYNDKNCYPTEDEWGSKLRSKTNCGSSSVFSWLNPWPCEPNGEPYIIQFEDSLCPRWYKVMALLENGKDKDIPEIVKKYSIVNGFPEAIINGEPVNYGISSTNINWYENLSGEGCIVKGGKPNCHKKDSGGTCKAASVGDASSGHTQCSGNNCYFDSGCSDNCRTFYCDSQGKY